MSKQPEKDNDLIRDIKPQARDLGSVLRKSRPHDDDVLHAVIANTKHRQMLGIREGNYEKAKKEKLLNPMKKVDAGFVAVLNGQQVSPLEYTLYHDGNFKFPPVLFVKNLPSRKSTAGIDVYESPADLFQVHKAISSHLQDRVKNYSKENLFENSAVLFEIGRVVNNFVQDYTSTGNTAGWAVLDASNPAVFQYSVMSHVLEANSASEFVKDTLMLNKKGFARMMLDEMHSSKDRENFQNACQQMLVINQSPGLTSADISITNTTFERDGSTKAHNFEVANNFPMSRIEDAFGVDVHCNDNVPMVEQERAVFVEHCRTLGERTRAKENANNEFSELKPESQEKQIIELEQSEALNDYKTQLQEKMETHRERDRVRGGDVENTASSEIFKRPSR